MISSIVTVGAVIKTDAGNVQVVVPLSGTTNLRQLPSRVAAQIARKYPQHIGREVLEIRYDVQKNRKST